MKRVLFIIYSYTMGGGAESLLTSIVNHLNPNKYQVSIIEIVHSDVKVEPVREGINVLPYMMRADDPERKTKMYSFYHEWDKVIDQYIPDDYDLYVSFNMQRPSFLLPPNKKNIAWIHSDLFFLSSDEKKEEYELQRKAFEKCNRIVAISDITSQSLHQLFPEIRDKIVDIYNGIDICRVNEKSKEYEAKDTIQHPAFLYCGRLEERKQPLKAIDWIKALHKNGVEAHLYYMGYGPLSGDAEEYAKELGLDDYVHFFGYVENPFPIMKEIDITLMTSRWEGFPMNLLESVALGVPFISTHVGGAIPLSDDGNAGYVVESTEDLYEAASYLLKCEKNELKKKCSKTINEFSIDKYVKRIEQLFDEVMAED